MYKINHKRSKRWRTLCTVFAFLAMFFLYSSQTFAQETSTASLSVKQTIKINNDYSLPKDRFTYVLEAITDGAPLPHGAQGRYSFDLIGNEEKQLDIQYLKAGEYNYRLYQQKNHQVEHVSQDLQVYDIHIRVIQTEKGLVVSEYMIVNDEFYKVTDLHFTNHYQIPPTVPSEPSTPQLSQGLVPSIHVLLKQMKKRLPKTGEMLRMNGLIGLIWLFVGVVLLGSKKKEEQSNEL